MKKLFLSMVALMVAAMSYAQNTLVATLTHGDEITTFYGADALLNAKDAAVSGDIITLSGGTFNGVSITKGVTIRGTGIDNINPTSITSVGINIPEEDTCRFVMEGVKCISQYGSFGIHGSSPNPYILKCQFVDVKVDNASIIDNIQIVNCKISGTFSNNGINTITFAHCFVRGYNTNKTDEGKALFLNCVVFGNSPAYYRTSFISSIIADNYQQSLPEGTFAMNCVGINYYSNIFKNMQEDCKVDCYVLGSGGYKTLFKNQDVTTKQPYELNDAAKTNYLGIDGTEVGLYGGEYPYDSTPSYPVITKLNVAKQSTADDKLSVEIEVSAVE